MQKYLKAEECHKVQSQLEFPPLTVPMNPGQADLSAAAAVLQPRAGAHRAQHTCPGEQPAALRPCQQQWDRADHPSWSVPESRRWPLLEEHSSPSLLLTGTGPERCMSMASCN